jgi:hypothetical protein
MTISVRQVSTDITFSSPASLSLASTPLEGSLLLAFAVERSGTTLWTMSSAGWTKRAERYQSPADGTFRKSLATWSKVAGAAEPTGITVTPTGGGGPIALGIVELAADAGEFASLAFGAGVASGSDTVAAFYDSGSTASVSSTNKLLVGLCYTKVGNGDERPYSDWTAGTDDLTEFVEINGGGSSLDVSWAWALSSATGANSTRATKDAGTVSAERGAITSLLVFDLGGGGTSLNRSVADTAGAADALARTGSRARAAADTAAAGDALARTSARSRTQGDAAAAADGLSRGSSRPRALADTAGAADALSRATSRARSHSDTAAASDGTARTVTRARTQSDAAPASDVTAASTTGQLTRSTADAAGANDTLGRAVTQLRTSAEVAAGTDTSARSAARTRALSDSAPTADTASASSTGNLSRALSEAAPAGDAPAYSGTRARSTADAAPGTDGTARHGALGRAVGDTAALTDLSARALTQARQALDSALTADATAGSYQSGVAPVPVTVTATLAARHVGASLRERGAAGRLKPRAVTAGVNE